VFGSTVAGITAILGTVVGAIGTVITAIAGLPVALVAAIAAIAAFAAAYITNWKGTREKTNAIIGKIVDLVTSGFNTLKTNALNLIGKLTTKAVSKFNTLLADLKGWASDLADKAIEWGKGLIDGFIDGIKEKVGQLRTIIDNISSGNFDAALNVATGSGSSNTSNSTTGRFPTSSTGSGGPSIALDGRRVDESLGRYGRDGTARRGI